MSIENDYIKRYTPVLGIPSNDEGFDGDLRLRLLPSGSVGLFGKVQGIWLKIASDFKAVDSEGEIVPINPNDDQTTPTSMNGIIELQKNAVKVSRKSGIAKAKADRLILDENTAVTGSLKVETIAAQGSDTDKFLVSDGGLVKYRTGAEVLSDIGADTHTAASTSASGIVELATTAETTTGTDTARAVTPDGLKDGYEGSSNIETVGTVGTGEWEGTAITNDYIAALPTSKITSGTMADARIASSNVTQHEGDIDAVGALNGGSITSGFGNINNGSSTITTTGAIAGGTVTGTTMVQSNGNLLADSGTLTSSGSADYSIGSAQTLNQGLPALGTQTYTQIKTTLVEADSGGWDTVNLIDQQVGGASKFKVTNAGAATFASTVTSSNGLSGLWQTAGNSNISYRGNTINTWYVGNQSIGTSITTGDFDTYKFSSAMFTANHGANLQGWNFVTTFSSAHDFEVELWDIELPSAGGSSADSAIQVGATQSVTATALKIYALGQQSLDYVLSANHQLYLAIRYTDGSGTFYTYGTLSMEFTNA